jgi:hypothetical protein
VEAPSRIPLPELPFITALLLDEFVFWVRQNDSCFKCSKLGAGNKKSSKGIFKIPLEPSYWHFPVIPFHMARQKVSG